MNVTPADLSALVKTFEGHVSAEAALRDVQEIWRRDRWSSFDMFRESAAYCAQRMGEAGLEEAETIPFPADGTTVFGDLAMPWAWDARSAELRIVAPEASPTLVASYRQIPQNLMMYSNATEPPGVEAEAVLIEDAGNAAAYDGLDVRGKVVLTSSEPRRVVPLAAARGAIGLVSDYMVLARGVSDRETQKDAVGWINDGFDSVGTRRRDGLNIFGFIVSPRQGDRLRRLIREHGSLRLYARVDTSFYDGTLDVATGLLAGTDLRDEEVLLTAHLYEPGASDNASGAAAVLEAARVMAAMVRGGRLPPPRRSIRVVLGHEVLGLGAWLFQRRERSQRPLGGLNLDDICPSFDRLPSLRVHAAHDACPCFTGYLGDCLASEFTGRFPYLRVRLHDGFNQIDNHGCDPIVGAPMSVLCVHEKRWYHTSEDTPARLDRGWLALNAAVAAAYAWTLANAGSAEALGLARLGLDPARLHFLKRAQERIRAVEADGRRTFAAERLAEAVRFLAEIEVQGMRNLRRFVPEAERRAFDESVETLAEPLRDLGEVERRRARRIVRALPAASERCRVPALARRLVPARRVFGLLCMENLPEEAQREQEADPSLRLSVWGGTQGLVFWCDGRRTVYDVALAIGHSTGRYDVELTMKRLRFLERYGYIEMRRLAAPKA